MSPTTADNLYTAFNVAILIGGAAAFIGSVGAYWTGKVREQYADERISKNEAITAQAVAETERAKLEQERIKAQLAFRRLTKQQHDAIASAVRERNVSIHIGAPLGDAEAVLFASEIARTLREAGATVDTFEGNWAVPPIGLFLGGPSAEAATVVGNALAVAGLSFGRTESRDHLLLIVGSKPSQF